MDYQLAKALHLLGVAIFLGNIIVTALWKLRADITKNPVIISYAQRLVTVTDFAFTVTGVILIALTGRVMAAQFGGMSEARWVVWGVMLFGASGVIWALVLIPIQVKQAKLARGFGSGGVIPARYWAMSKAWYAFGAVATLLPLANLYVMVFKPA